MALAAKRKTNPALAPATDALTRKALELPAAPRQRLVTRLLASLAPPGLLRSEAEWEAEIDRRLIAVSNGTARTLSWDDVVTHVRRKRR